MRVNHALLLLTLLSAATSCLAQSAPPEVVAEVRGMLMRGDFAQLEERYGKLQRDYVAGNLPEEQLRNAFRVFYETDPALAPAYSRWVAQSPKSYVAHLARGFYYRFLGMESRGEASAADTSEKQFASLREAHAIAAKELDLSIPLDPKPLLSYHGYLDICLHRGAHTCARQMLERGLAFAPKSFLLREKYMVTLTTKWGGSIEEMRTFADESRAAGLPSGQMASLNAMVIEDEGWNSQYRDGDLDAAANSYRRAARLDPSRDCAVCSPDYQLAFVLQQQGLYPKAVVVASRVLKDHPDDVDMLAVRGHAYTELRNGPKAHADLLKGAKLGDAWAQTALGRLLLAGDLLPANRSEAIEWLELAAKQGYPDAIRILDTLPHSQPPPQPR